MKFRPFLLLALFTAIFACAGHAQAFRFSEGSYAQALARAAKEGKMLLVMTTAAVSEASVMMVEEVMANEEVGSFFNQHFLGWVLDIDPLAPEFVFEGFHLVNVPEYIFIDNEGEIQYRASGYQTPAEMIALGKEALDPANHFSAMQAAYNAGKRDPEFMQEYIFNLNANGKPAKEIAEKYLATLKPEALLLAPNWKITSAIVDDAGSREVRHVLQNYGRYCEKFDETAVRQFLLDVYNLSFARAVQTQDIEVLRKAHPLLEKINPSNNMEGIRATVEVNFFAAIEDWEAYKEAALAAFNSHSGHNSMAYNDAAANFFYHVDDPEALKKALTWASLSIEMDRQAYNLDTKAALLYKLGDKEAALDMAREAVEMAGDEIAPVEFSIDLLQNEK